MKILVTGAAGFIGGQLWHTLWKRGDEVVGIDNFSYGNPDNLKFDDHDFGAEVRRMDIRDKAGMLALFEAEKFDVVYNIAGIAPLPDCQSDPVQAIEVNTLGLVNLLEAGRRTGIKQLVQASTNAMYENETEFPTVEGKFNPPTLIYPNTKYCGERFAQSFADTYGMTVTCLRFANVYGPHIDCLRKQPPFVGYMIRELYYDRTPEFHSDGNQRRDYIYVDDLIALALRVVEHPQKGFDAVNVSSNQSYSVRELYAIANRLMGKNIEAKYCPSSHYWAKYPELYGGAYGIKPEILDHEVNKFSQCDNTHAREVYGWQPQVDIETGLDVFDVLVGINLLREGLDIPEVSLVAILDADKEGFLRSETSLIQTIGRAARNAEGRVIMYADKRTDSMDKAISETERRRKIQDAYNKEHGITPQTIKKAVRELIRISSKADAGMEELQKDPEYMSEEELQKQIAKIMKKMNQAAAELNFELAASLRDQMIKMKKILQEME